MKSLYGHEDLMRTTVDLNVCKVLSTLLPNKSVVTIVQLHQHCLIVQFKSHFTDKRTDNHHNEE